MREYYSANYMIDTILDLAKDCTPEKRRQLVDHITNLFVALSLKDRSEELKLFNNMLEGIYAFLDADARFVISDRLAGIDTTSPRLARKLANDDFRVARPTLERSNALSQSDMIEIAQTKGPDYLMALARRDHLGPELTKVLLSRGEKNVRHAVAANLGAEITEDDFNRALAEMPEKLGQRTRHLRKSNQELIDDLFRTEGEIAAGAALEKREVKFDAFAWLFGIKHGKVTVNQAVAKLTVANNLYEIVHILAALTGLEAKYVHSLMIRYDATGLACVCRTAGVGAAEYGFICKVRSQHLKLPESTGKKWLTNYHMLDETDGRRLTTLMKMQLQVARRENAA